MVLTAASSAGFTWVATLCLLPHENVFSKPCCQPMGSLDRSHRHSLPVSGNKHALLRAALEETTQVTSCRPTRTLSAVGPPPCGLTLVTALESQRALPQHCVGWMEQGPRPWVSTRCTMWPQICCHPCCPMATLSSSCLL